jgi:hypothetical protein
MAFKQVSLNAHFTDWSGSRIPTCLQADDYSCAASALGEIRAAGELLQAAFDIRPVPESDKPTCDFKILLNGFEAYVEVATKQMAGETVNYLQGTSTSHERSICPGGAPDPNKKDETIGENAGHKFASIKPTAKQVPTGSVALLWIDIQDEDWWPAEKAHARPVVSHNGDFYSGGIWHGFYGQRGTPLFESQSTEERAEAKIYLQSYPGLFTQHRRWSAAVLSFRDVTILFEHPSPECPMPRELTKKLLGLQKADYSEWWVNWPSMRANKVLQRVDETVSELQALACEACYKW